jgi:mannose-6-phosphate isomerase-like protein (cupin superfamily)
MPILKQASATMMDVKPGVKRRMIFTDKLHTVVIDFSNGPWSAPDPFHNHIHEQITYVEHGVIDFLCEGEETQRLTAGDVFAVPSNKQHTIQLLSPTARLVDSFTPLREDFVK